MAEIKDETTQVKRVEEMTDKELAEKEKEVLDEGIKFPSNINAGPHFYTVEGFVSGPFEKYKQGIGYIDTEERKVYVYQKTKPAPGKVNEKPYFWIETENDDSNITTQKICKSHPSEYTLRMYTVAKVFDNSITTIMNNTNEGESLFNEEMLNDMNSSTAIYKPIINEKDDFLKKIVKMVMLEKEVDISRLKHKLDQKYVLPNMVAALKGDTKMSVVYFNIWADILGFDFKIMIEDNGRDKLDTMNHNLVYLSDFDKVITDVEYENNNY